MVFFLEFGARSKLVEVLAVIAALKQLDRPVPGEKSSKGKRVVFPFGFLCWAHITGRKERIGAIHVGKQVGNRFQGVMGTTDSVRHVKRKHVLGVGADVFASNLQRLLQVGSKGGFHPKILAIHPGVNDESDALHVDAVFVAELLRDAREGFEQRFFLDVLGAECNDAYQSSTSSGR